MAILLKKQDNFCQFCWKNIKFLAIFWQSNGNFPEGQSTTHYVLMISPQNLVYVLEEKFLSGHRWLLQGCSSATSRPGVTQEIHRAAQSAVEQVRQTHRQELDLDTVISVMSVLLTANAKEVVSLLGWVATHFSCSYLLYCVLPTGLMGWWESERQVSLFLASP